MLVTYIRAKPEQFTNFSLPGLNEYSILENHRCTNKIVSVLNDIRTDITQNGKRDVEGVPPRILIGGKIWTLDKACELAGGIACSLYLVPATEWANDIYPFKGKDYNKPGQVSAPEWGISFSDKAKDAMEPYRFANMLANYV